MPPAISWCSSSVQDVPNGAYRVQPFEGSRWLGIAIKEGEAGCDRYNSGVILSGVWEVVLLEEVEQWFLDLALHDPHSAELVAGALDLLEAEGPTLGRPAVDRVKHSRQHNMKELRPGSSGSTELRLLFVFDPKRRAVVLVAGDKAGNWSQWYRDNIPVAEKRYTRWLEELEEQER